MNQIRKNIDQAELKEKLSKAVCLFLAEMLRTRSMSLERSAEIAAGIVEQLDEIQNEMHFLEVVREMEYEFQELKQLERDLVFYNQVGERERMEEVVRQYAINYLPDNPEAAVEIMEKALLSGTTLDDLIHEFPEFEKFVSKL